jgi:choline oxidase
VSDLYDYIVIGSGTGSVVAARLAEDPSVSVCLLEAGPSDKSQERILDFTRWAELLCTELDYDYAIEPQARGNSSIRQSRGRMLGGSTSHNGCVAFRGPDHDLDQWANLGASGWDAQSCRPFYERVKAMMRFTRSDSENPVVLAFLEACEAAGLTRMTFDLDMGDVQDAASWTLLNSDGRWRQSSSVAYLHSREELENLDILCSTVATRVLIDNEARAHAVETTRGVLRADREIIVACGAIETPKLLLLSGIGPDEQLREFGLTQVVDLPGVGAHLIDHTESALMWEAAKRFPLSNSIDTAALFRSSEDEETADVLSFFVPAPYSEIAAEGTNTSGTQEAPQHAFSIGVCPMRPASEGWVKLRSAEPLDPPRIDPGYFTDPGGLDEQVMVAGMRAVRRIAEQPPLAEWIAREVSPGLDVESDEDLSLFGRQNSITGYHPAGTCKIGSAEDPEAVVDPELKVNGIEGLRIADASVFPSMIAVNINMTCMMIGERCADFINEERTRSPEVAAEEEATH